MVILFSFFSAIFVTRPPIIWYVGMFFPSRLIPYPTTIGKIHDSPLLHHHLDLKHRLDRLDSQTKLNKTFYY